MSIVAIAKPAPFTIQPMLPSAQRSSGRIRGFQLAFVFLGIYRAIRRFSAGGRGRCCRYRFCHPRRRARRFSNCQRVHFKQGKVVFDKRFGTPVISLTNSLICLSFQPSWNATSRAWQGCRPTSGSTVTLKIFSGFQRQPFSISTPPSVEAMNVMRRVERSTTAPKYSLGLHRIHVFANQNAVDRLTVGIGLISNQIGANQAFCHFFGFFTAFDDSLRRPLYRVPPAWTWALTTANLPPSLSYWLRLRRCAPKYRLARQAVTCQQFLPPDTRGRFTDFSFRISGMPWDCP